MEISVQIKTVDIKNSILIALFPRTLSDIGKIIHLDQKKPYTVKIKDNSRSTEQNRYYWNIVLPTCQYYLNELSHCPNPKNKTDIDNAHFTLKLLYCFEVRPDMAEMVTYYDPVKKKTVKRVIPFSAKISEMSQKKFNAYLDWIKMRVNKSSGLLWEQAIKEVL